MLKRKLCLTIASSIGAALAPCASQPPVPPSRLYNIPQDWAKPDRCPPNISAKTVVRLRINFPLNLTKAASSSRYKNYPTPPISEDDDAAYDSSLPIPNPGPEAKRNTFHVHLKRIPNIDPAGGPSYAKIKVVLPDKEYGFVGEDQPGSRVKGIVYVPEPSGDHRSAFCQDDAPFSYAGMNHDKSVVTFYFDRSKLVSASINILIVPSAVKGATNGLETPIIIDPKIMNDG